MSGRKIVAYAVIGCVAGMATVPLLIAVFRALVLSSEVLLRSLGWTTDRAPVIALCMLFAAAAGAVLALAWLLSPPPQD